MDENKHDCKKCINLNCAFKAMGETNMTAGTICYGYKASTTKDEIIEEYRIYLNNHKNEITEIEKNIETMSNALNDAYSYIDELSDKNEDLSTRNTEMMFYIAELQRQLYEANMRAETLYRHLLLQQDRKNIVEVE